MYTPLVTAVDLQVEAPCACTLLPQAATALKVKVGNESTWSDATAYFSAAHGAIGITWSPSGDEEGKAAHLTVYTGSLKLAAGGAADKSVEYAFADSLDLYVNGAVASNDSAWVSERDGSKYLNAVFPQTGAYVYASLRALDDVNISFEDAVAAKSVQDSGSEGDWGLPREVGVTFACGESDLVDIEWGQVDGFDPTNLGAQTLTAQGRVCYPSYVDATGAPETVEVTVHVAAHGQVAAPMASLASGTYSGAQSVELVCATGDATIRYTTDGTEPTSKSTVYEGDPIEVANGMTLKAKAFFSGWTASETSTYEYGITYRVTFDSAGGSSVDAQGVVAGQAATEPAAPTRDGYDFKGWTLDGEAYDFADPVGCNLTLVATWEKKDGGGSGDDSGDDPDVDPDDPDVDPDDPDVDPDDPDVDPDVDPDGKGDEQPDGKGDEQPAGKKGDSSKRKTLPGTGDPALLAAAGVAAAGALVAGYGALRLRRKE